MANDELRTGFHRRLSPRRHGGRETGICRKVGDHVSDDPVPGDQSVGHIRSDDTRKVSRKRDLSCTSNIQDRGLLNRSGSIAMNVG